MALIPKILSNFFSKKTIDNENEAQVPQAHNDGFWNKLGSQLRNFFTPSNYGIAGSDTVESSVAKEANDVTIDSWALLKDTIPLTIDTEQRLVSGLEERVRARGHYFFTLGLEDGIKGTKNENAVLDVSEGEARNIVEDFKAISLGKTKALESEKKVRQSIFEDEKHRYEVARDYLDRITYYYQHEQRSFAVGLGVIYFVVALALIFADIPLAIKLTIEGFYLPDDMFSYMLVIGLALCTVYVKIYYDDYLASPLGTWVTQFKKNPGIRKQSKAQVDSENKKTDSQQDALNEEKQIEEDKEGVKREYKVKFRVKTLLLFFTLGTIVVLGIFRYQNIGPDEQSVLINYSKWLYANHIVSDETQGLIWALRWTKLAFILITLIFPIIGGICLSLSFNIFQNRWRLSKANNDFDKTRKRHVVALGNLNTVEQAYEDLNNVFNEWQGNQNGAGHIKFFSDVFIAYYRLGYDDGYREPDFYDKSADIYTQVEQMRRKVIARKVYDLLAPQS